MVESVVPAAGSSVSEMLEHLLTRHPFRRQIAALPDDQIERLSGMLKQAVAKKIGEQDIYDAVTRGFQTLESPSFASPPLAFDLRSDGDPARDTNAPQKAWAAA